VSGFAATGKVEVIRAASNVAVADGRRLRQRLRCALGSRCGSLLCLRFRHRENLAPLTRAPPLGSIQAARTRIAHRSATSAHPYVSQTSRLPRRLPHGRGARIGWGTGSGMQNVNALAFACFLSDNSVSVSEVERRGTGFVPDSRPQWLRPLGEKRSRRCGPEGATKKTVRYLTDGINTIC
jgi:hypothetical protein